MSGKGEGLTLGAARRAWLRELGVERIWTVRRSAPAEVSAAPDAPQANATAAPVPRPQQPVAPRSPEPMPAPVIPAAAAAPAAVPAAADRAWAILQEEVAGCVKCGLCKGRTQTVFGVGTRSASLMIVGEAPGEQEDRQGEPFVGRSGKLLDSMLGAVGRARKQDVFIANVIKCRPPGNRDPQPEEVAQCSPYLMRQIELVRPAAILVLGRFAAQTLLGTDASIGSLRGRVHSLDVAGRSTPMVVSYHPAYLLRSPQEKSKTWQDLQLAQSLQAGSTST